MISDLPQQDGDILDLFSRKKKNTEAEDELRISDHDLYHRPEKEKKPAKVYGLLFIILCAAAAVFLLISDSEQEDLASEQQNLIAVAEEQTQTVEEQTQDIPEGKQRIQQVLPDCAGLSHAGPQRPSVIGIQVVKICFSAFCMYC